MNTYCVFRLPTTTPPPLRSGPKAASKPSRQNQIPRSPERATRRTSPRCCFCDQCLRSFVALRPAHPHGPLQHNVRITGRFIMSAFRLRHKAAPSPSATPFKFFATLGPPESSPPKTGLTIKSLLLVLDLPQPKTHCFTQQIFIFRNKRPVLAMLSIPFRFLRIGALKRPTQKANS